LNGDGCRRSIRCKIHLLTGLWRASGGLVGGTALAAENELASSISAEASSYAMANRPAIGLGMAPEHRFVRDWRDLSDANISCIPGNSLPGCLLSSVPERAGPAYGHSQQSPNDQISRGPGGFRPAGYGCHSAAGICSAGASDRAGCLAKGRPARRSAGCPKLFATDLAQI
jgi:hypothetical protein